MTGKIRKAVSCALPALILAAVAGALFSLGITEGHIGLDDWGYTSGCPFVKGGLGWANLKRAFTDLGYGAMWMPVTFASYMLDVTLFGDNWRAYHAVNVCFHAINAILVFEWVKSQLQLFTAASPRRVAIASFVGALLWAVHPQRAEAVSFVAARKDELWTLFTLCGLMAYDRFLKAPGWKALAAVWTAFALAALSKSTAIAFPFLAGSMYVAYRCQRCNRAVRQVGCLHLLPLLLFAVIMGMVALHSQSHPSAAEAVDVYAASFVWRVLNAVVAVGLYFWYLFFPAGIHIDYRAVFDGVPVNCALGLGCFAMVAAIFVFALVRGGQRWRLPIVYCAALFVFSLGPTLGIFGYVNGDQAMADRYVYFPHIAIALLLGFAIAEPACGSGQPSGEGARHSLACWMAIAAVLFACEVFFVVPSIAAYENGYAAYSRVLAIDPNHWRALRIVGNEYCARRGRMQEGVDMLRRSLELRPSLNTAESLAYVLAIRAQEGDFAEVKRLCSGVAQQSVRDPHGMMLDALAIVAMREGQYLAAVHYFTMGLKVAKRNHSPDHSLLNLGLCLANLGKDHEALAVLSKAAQCGNPTVRGRAVEAMEAIRRTVARAPFEWR